MEEAVGKAHISTVAASAAVTVPAAIFILTVWLLHSRHYKVTLVQQLVLPVAAVLVLACTFAGAAAVLLAGVVCALTVAVGLLLHERHPAAAE